MKVYVFFKSVYTMLRVRHRRGSINIFPIHRVDPVVVYQLKIESLPIKIYR